MNFTIIVACDKNNTIPFYIKEDFRCIQTTLIILNMFLQNIRK
jgi:hypothetical protein